MIHLLCNLDVILIAVAESLRVVVVDVSLIADMRVVVVDGSLIAGIILIVVVVNVSLIRRCGRE